MKKMRFLGLLLAFSFIFMNFAQAQFSTTLTRIAGGTTTAASASVCDNSICLSPWSYPVPSSHTFAMATSNVLYIVVLYPTGSFNLLRSTVDGAAGFYAASNGTNTLLIRRASAGVYEFFII
jgi:hypothetical protein